MHLPATLGSRSSSESDRSISMTRGSPPSLQKQRAGIIISSTTTDPLANLDSWTSSVGTTNAKAFMSHKLGTSGRGRLPSIGEVHPASKLTFPAQEGFAQMFSQNNDSVFVKRRNPQLAQQQSTHQGPRPIKDRIIRHSLSESHLRSRVEPVLDDHQHQANNVFNENTNVWLTPATAVGTTRQPSTRPLPGSNQRNGHREIVTIDGRLRRVRFLSADHIPAKEDPEFKQLLFLNRKVTEVKNNSNTETVSKVKSSEGKTSPVRSTAVSAGRKCSVDNGEATAPRTTTNDKKETPDVWLERARKLRASKDRLNNNVTRAESTSKRSESMKIHDELNENLHSNRISDKIPSTSKHVNYCDAKKTEWVKKWLDEVNSQTHFDIIE